MLRLLGKLVITLTGWRREGPLPDAPRCVLIAAPHTSNWDLLHLLTLAWACGIRISWMGKHTLFRGPLGLLARRLGGVSVHRGRSNDLVRQMADVFASREHLILTVPPEATRSRADYWKSGFYRIALEARVPIYFGYIDYRTKRGGFGSYVEPSGDIVADMDVIRAFYQDKCARYPHAFGPVRLREEVESTA